MIRRIEIENFKSIQKLGLDLGRVTVLIGENGGGKSNLLEAIAFVSAGMARKLDHEFMASRGIRMTEARLMRPVFPGAVEGDIEIRVMGEGNEKEHDFTLHFFPVEETGGTVWRERSDAQLLEHIKNLSKQWKQADQLATFIAGFKSLLEHQLRHPEGYKHFLIYSPENTPLRSFEKEGQILPLGIDGAGLFSHLKYLASKPENAGLLEEIAQNLELIGWFERFEMPKHQTAFERTLLIRDRYLAEGALFDQRSANEGFLFLLFYFTLFISPHTPSFFAIDNVDASLNPKLCRALCKTLVELAKKHEKQVILTTHNPAILDGLNLNDDEQRLFVVSRDDEGATTARRIEAPKAVEGRPPVKLSEAFMQGYIGGLPKNF